MRFFPGADSKSVMDCDENYIDNNSLCGIYTQTADKD